jgi:tetratricopeptide (TPR) repeat protein
MHKNERLSLVLIAVLGLSVATWISCNRANNSSPAAASSNSGKIPITTKSEEARKEFLLGQDFSDRYLNQEACQHFDKAIALDPNFALAELGRANNSLITPEFFEHEKKAFALVDKVSQGEKLLILANEAGANGNVVKQTEYLQQLVAAYPNDERAHFDLARQYTFFQKDPSQAIEQGKKTIELSPGFSPIYNVLGYAYWQQHDYANAEQAFKKYIELVPNDAGPYDGYAELLLKLGRFDDAIAQGRKALSVDPHYVHPYLDISAGLMYQSKAEEAAAELQKMAAQAHNDFDLRDAIVGLAVVAADSGRLDKALQEIDKSFAVAEKKADVANMAGDLQTKGSIALEMHKYDLAKQQFDRSLQMIQTSGLSQEIKDTATLLQHYDLAVLATEKRDSAAAKTHAEEFRKGAEASKDPALMQQAHELAGKIALAERDYDKAIAELQQASLQDPGNLYRLGQAYQGKGDSSKAQEFYVQAAEFNSLPQLSYAFIRLKAKKMAAG